MRSCEGCGAVFNIKDEGGIRNYRNHTCFQADEVGFIYESFTLFDLAMLDWYEGRVEGAAECYL